jgi:pimeloyl-ACP methyl ester carboxylesterase
MNFVTAADGVKLAYDVTGQGTPLLCLPGLTRNMEDFDPVVEAYADRATVIRMDFRGRGASDYADPSTYQVPQEAADVLALLDHLKLEKVTILGTSRGGLVAMVLAAMAKDRLAGVILNDVGPEIMTEGLAAIMTYIGRPPPHRTLVDAAGAMPAAYADSFQNVPPATWAAFAGRLFREDRDGLHLRYDPRLREAVAPAFAPDAVTPDLWPFFDAFAGLPLGLIRGANSNLLSVETAEEMQRRRPDMVFGEVPRRGHVPFLDEPEAQAVISTVLDKVS